jgi:protein-L-isoaspartate(D-aspartate) O-methyltransferase
VVTPAGFMTAAGPLSARYPGAHPEPVRGRVLPMPTVRHPPAWRSALGAHRYHDLWFAAGVWDRRVTFAPVDGTAGAGGCTVLDEAGGGGATITTDGSVLGCGPQAGRYAAEALALRDRWIREGEPTVGDWRADLTLTGEPDQPIWVPQRWTREG